MTTSTARLPLTPACFETSTGADRRDHARGECST